ncbi:MAG: hypothetical protein Q9163_005761, partial [Psora crenata]
NFPTQLNWTTVDLVTAVCVTSLPALNVIITRQLPLAITKYWSSIHKDTDEFGHPHDTPRFPKNDKARDPSDHARVDEWAELQSKDGVDGEANAAHCGDNGSINLRAAA